VFVIFSSWAGAAHASTTTVYDQTSALTGTSDTNLNNVTFRWVFPPSGWIATPSGTQLRITIIVGTAQSSGTDLLSSFYVAQQASSGDPFDFESTPTHITWNGGNDGVGTVGAGSVVTSDWVTLPETFDPTKAYVISGYTVPGSDFEMSGANDAFVTVYTNSPGFGGNDASTVTPTGANYGQEENFFPTPTEAKLISKIEVQSVGSGRIIRLRGGVRLIGGVRLGGTSLITKCKSGFSQVAGGFCQGFLTSGTTFTVPTNWNSSNNTIEAIGGGGAGTNTGFGGGGGAAYANSTNVSLTPGASVTIKIGAGGLQGISGAATAGGDTIFNSSASDCSGVSLPALCAKGGGVADAAGPHAGKGGAAASSVGSTKYSGGDSPDVVEGWAGTGGGGAGGPNGAGGAGGQDFNNTEASPAGGGGGNGGGSAGGNANSTVAGDGGDNFGGTGHGTGASSLGVSGTAGTNGGGGGGGVGSNSSTKGGNGAAGGAGTEWDATHGSGGGGGGGGPAISGDAGNGGNGGLYGAGGGATGSNDADTLNQVAGNGAQGIIVITYTP
jgi:hypothetical protein